MDGKGDGRLGQMKDQGKHLITIVGGVDEGKCYIVVEGEGRKANPGSEEYGAGQCCAALRCAALRCAGLGWAELS